MRLFAYRPENTHRSVEASCQADLNTLYWSSDECVVSASEVVSECQVVCGEDIEGDMDQWFLEGENRFYFYEAYDSSNEVFTDAPYHARGRISKGKVSCGSINQHRWVSKCCM